jgi:ribosome recycling factor
MIPELKKTTEHKMHRSIDALKRISPRCARAVPTIGILDHVMVEYYGSPCRLPRSPTSP